MGIIIILQGITFFYQNNVVKESHSFFILHNLIALSITNLNYLPFFVIFSTYRHKELQVMFVTNGDAIY
jgi:hypothetical protein